MNQAAAAVPREVVEQIVAELERLMDDARDRWSIPKGADQVHSASWHNREIAYRQVLQLLAVSGSAPKYAARK